MNFALKLAFLFFCGSTFGWIFELFLRRYVTQKRWMNPGFLTGPYLPIYGFGLTTMYLITDWINKMTLSPIVRDILVIVSIGFFMTLIEYIAGLIFIKGMKIKLWDYSDRWGNVKGIICPLFSALWTVFGALYYYLIYQYDLQSIKWLEDNLAFSFFIGFFFGVLVIDLWKSLNLSTKIRKYAIEKNVMVKYEKFKGEVLDRNKKAKQKLRFLNPFRSMGDINEEMDNYIEKEKDVKNIDNIAES